MISETIKKETQEQIFPPILLVTVAASILANVLAGKEVIKTG